MMERETHVGPGLAAHSAVEPAVDAPAPVRRFAEIAYRAGESIDGGELNAGGVEQSATEASPE